MLHYDTTERGRDDEDNVGPVVAAAAGIQSGRPRPGPVRLREYTETALVRFKLHR